jgi:hypothetical protein
VTVRDEWHSQFWRYFRPILLLLFFLQVPALKDVFKYLPNPVAGTAIMLVACAALYYTILFTSFGKKVLSSKWCGISVLLFTGIAGAIIYPRANGLSASGGGSIADDAIIMPIASLLGGHGLYDVNIGMPVSPGPGWLLLNIPFAFRWSIFLINVVYLGVLLLVCRRIFGDFLSGNRLLIIFASSLLFWDLSVTGYDHFAIGVALLLLVLMVSEMKLTKVNVAAGALITGIVATARIIFFPLGLLLGMVLLRRSRFAGALFAVVSILCTSLLHGGFYLASNIYQPFHLFSKAYNDTGLLPIIIAGGVTLAIGIPLLMRKHTGFADFAGTVLFWLGMPLGFAAWGELHAYSYQLASWEGAHYLFVLAPLAAGLVIVPQYFTSAAQRTPGAR